MKNLKLLDMAQLPGFGSLDSDSGRGFGIRIIITNPVHMMF